MGCGRVPGDNPHLAAAVERARANQSDSLFAEARRRQPSSPRLRRGDARFVDDIIGTDAYSSHDIIIDKA